MSELDGPSKPIPLWRAVALVLVLGLVGLNVLHNRHDEEVGPVAVTPVATGAIATSARVEVVMYSTSWCGYCRAARAWLKGQGIAYVDHDVERDPVAHARHMALSPGGGVPVFEVDGTVAHGFDAISLGRLIAQASAKRATR